MLIPVLTKAIQEQQTIIDDLKQKTKETESKYDTLLKEIELIKNTYRIKGIIGMARIQFHLLFYCLFVFHESKRANHQCRKQSIGRYPQHSDKF